MRDGQPVFVALAAILTGCLGAPGPLGLQVDAEIGHGPQTMHVEGAEGTAGWTARTWLAAGLDNRPGIGEWHRSSKEARTGNQSWTFQDEAFGRYHDQAVYDLHSPSLDLAGLERPEWRFFFRGESGTAGKDVFSWGMLVNGQMHPLGSAQGRVKDWTQVAVDLSAYKGKTVDLMFRFEADGCGGDTPVGALCDGGFSGYFLDDIELGDL